MNMIHVKDLKKGMTFFETCYGDHIHMVAKYDANKVINNEYTQWECTGVTPDGREIYLLMTEKLEHYGPRLYTNEIH